MLIGRQHSSRSQSTKTPNKNRHQVLLDYIVSHAEGDQIPYLQLSILGYDFLGLLNSGSSNTIVGRPGYEKLLALGLKLDTSDQTVCSVANGQKCSSIGMIRTPISLMGKLVILRVLVVPVLSHHLILGQFC
ncbi:hypothetical protein HHI36_016417 [Cryptolaemus montrouzieri]|uniref:Uncharacterized protein n=1 Tax=Cryptolaemus montrouzieri TaxID=559131 RepID=A0ABD2NJF4_9CUCU